MELLLVYYHKYDMLKEVGSYVNIGSTSLIVGYATFIYNIRT